MVIASPTSKDLTFNLLLMNTKNACIAGANAFTEEMALYRQVLV
jgi:hypothetical protein